MGAAALLGSALIGVSAGSALGAQSWLTEMAGDAVVPGPGDPDGFGIAILNTLDPVDGELCWTVSLEGLDELAAIQIFHGAPGDAGTLVYDLGTAPDADGLYSGCFSGQDQAALQDIVDNPADYFFQVATTAFAQGAVRGQLEGATVVERVQAGTLLCPAGIETLAQARAAGAGQGPSTEGEWNICAPTYPTGYTTPVADLPWLVQPAEIDLDLSVLPEGWSERLVTDARFHFGNGICDPGQNFCTSTGWFEWGQIPAGDTSIVQNLIPDGYHLGWARILVDGSDTVGSSSSVPLQLTGDEGDVYVWFFDVLDAAAASPSTSVVPPITDTPGSSLTLTPPPTSTAEGEAGGPGATALFTGLLALSGVGILIATLLRRGSASRG